MVATMDRMTTTPRMSTTCRTGCHRADCCRITSARGEMRGSVLRGCIEGVCSCSEWGYW